MVARDPLRYRRQILALKQALSELGCTVLFLDDQTGETGADLLLQKMRSSIDRFVDAALFIRAISVPQSAHINDGRILRIDQDPADLACILQADVSPG